MVNLCPNCHTVNPGANAFCVNCGTRIALATGGSQPFSNPTPHLPVQTINRVRSVNMALVFGVGVSLLIIIALLAAIILLLSGANKPQPTAFASVPTVAATTAPALPSVPISTGVIQATAGETPAALTNNSQVSQADLATVTALLPVPTATLPPTPTQPPTPMPPTATSLPLTPPALPPTAVPTATPLPPSSTPLPPPASPAFPYQVDVYGNYKINGATYGLDWKGPYLATGGDDKIVRVWDDQGNRPFILRDQSSLIPSVSWAGDSRRLAAIGEDGTIFIWDLNNGTQPIFKQTDNIGKIDCLAFSPDGTQLAIGTMSGEVRILDTHNNQVSVLSGGTKAARMVAWSPDGSAVAAAYFDKTVRIWNTSDHTLRATLTGHTDLVLAVAWSPDGSRVVSGGEDNTIRIWNAHNGQQLNQINDHTHWVRGLAWSPNGRLIVSASYDGTVRFWQAGTMQPAAQVLSLPGRGVSVVFHPDGRLAIVGDNGNAQGPGNITTLLLARINLQS